MAEDFEDSMLDENMSQDESWVELVSTSNAVAVIPAFNAMGWEDINEIAKIIKEIGYTYVANMESSSPPEGGVLYDDEFTIYVTMGDSDGSNRWYAHSVAAYQTPDGRIWAKDDQVCTF